VSRYQKKHSPTHHPDHQPIFISFFHLLRSIRSSLFKVRAWQPFCTTSVHVLFGLSLGLEPSTSYFIHFLTQSVSSFCTTCPFHCNLSCCSTVVPRLLIPTILRRKAAPLLLCRLSDAQQRQGVRNADLKMVEKVTIKQNAFVTISLKRC